MTLKLDLGCGPNPREGFIGLDQYTFDKENVVRTKLAETTWIFDAPVLGDVELVPVTPAERTYYKLPDSSVDEAHCSHFLEHLDMNAKNPERIRFVNELYRVLKPGATVAMVTPHWGSSRAYGDWTHADKPVCEFFHYYLSKDWRATNAPHCDSKWAFGGLNCNFSCQWGYTMREDLKARNQETQMFALANYRDAVEDMVATWTAVKEVAVADPVPDNVVVAQTPKKGKKRKAAA